MSSDPEFTRLHITPLNPNLLSTIIPPSILPHARNISYHTIETFPEKAYGFVDLPAMDADKLKKKLNGSILKGTKIRIEKARPAVDLTPVAEPDEPAKPQKERKDPSKKRKRGEETIPAVELTDRKVKRGWTTPAATIGKMKKEQKELKKVVKSKFTTTEECLFKTVLPPNVAANAKGTEAVKTNQKSKKGKDAVVHEFAKSTKFATFLRTSGDSGGARGKSVKEFVDGKGWVDEDGNVVEEVKPKEKKSYEAPKKVLKNDSNAVEQESSSESESDSNSSSDESEDETVAQMNKQKTKESATDSSSESDSSSKDDSSSEGESSDGEEEKVQNTKLAGTSVSQLPTKTIEHQDSSSESDSDTDDSSGSDSHTVNAASDNSPDASSSDSSESESDSDSDSSSDDEPTMSSPSKPSTVQPAPINTTISSPEISRPLSSSSRLSIVIPDSATQEIHPLEALYKRPKPDSTTTTEANPVSSFSFFGPDADSDMEDAGAADEQYPLTPFTKRDIEYRAIRSAAPTPDTAYANKRFVWPTDEDSPSGYGGKGKGKGGDEGEGDAVKGSKEAESDFQKWFYEHRGESTRGWKKRRRAAAKEVRHRENKKGRRS
ncbi:Nucleotide- alpha-beta plait protein [Rutstroemia sp. NJR-2017a WRK4]|nr:Nucleotide- alpha-beta plait protein [Rutstroemia sp. NJR-2017a WRK4]